MKREQLIGTYDRVLRSATDIQMFAHVIVAEHDERLHYSVRVPGQDTSYFTKLDRAIEFYNQQVSAIEPGIEVGR